MSLPLYPRGFMYLESADSLKDVPWGYTQHSLAFGALIVSTSTEVATLDFDGTQYVMIGYAVHVGSQGTVGDNAQILRDISRSFATNGSNGVEEYLYDLAGRYALIIRDKENKFVYNDAHGMRSVYYSEKFRSIGSHQAMFDDLFSVSKDSSLISGLQLNLRWSKSNFNEVTALIPNHKLNFTSWKQSRFFPNQDSPYSGLKNELKISYIDAIWKEQLDFYASKFKLILSMTGGLDSRASLAVASEHWPEIEAFTYSAIPSKQDTWAKSVQRDERIVSKMLEIIPMRHQFIKRGKDTIFSKSDTLTLGKNSAGSHGRWLLETYMELAEGPTFGHIRGNLHETARNYFAEYADPDDPIRGLQKFAHDRSVTESKIVASSIDTFTAELNEEIDSLSYKNLPQDYNALDMYYWEVRQGRWFSEVFNETDVAFETVIPFNHRRLIDIALSFSPDERSEGFLFHELINNNVPVLNFFGINADSNLYESSKKFKKLNREPKERIYESSIYSADKIELIRISNNGDLKIPIEYLRKGYSMVHDVEFDDIGKYPDPKKFTASLDLHNRFAKASASGYLYLDLILNENVIGTEDLSQWSEQQTITLTGLQEKDKVQLRLRVEKNCGKDSWSKASATKVNYRISGAQDLAASVLTNNPFMKLTMTEVKQK